MRKLVVSVFVSLDGPRSTGGPDEDRDGGFAHVGGFVPLFNEELQNM